MKNIFISGVSSGLGYALASEYLKQNYLVCAIGRQKPKTLQKHKNFHFLTCDLSRLDLLDTANLSSFIQKYKIDIAILNAGILGEIHPLKDNSLQNLKNVMEVNLWANKILIDILSNTKNISQIIAISSGASINGSKGWGAYSLSKAALNMLLKVYAKEHPDTHFTALAPGIIQTPMVEHIIHEVDENLFPSAKRLKNSPIQTPTQAAQNLLHTFPKLLEYESGSFLDIRTMKV